MAAPLGSQVRHSVMSVPDTSLGAGVLGASLEAYHTQLGLPPHNAMCMLELACL